MIKNYDEIIELLVQLSELILDAAGEELTEEASNNLYVARDYVMDNNDCIDYALEAEMKKESESEEG